jgi:hypothetical protein
LPQVSGAELLARSAADSAQPDQGTRMLELAEVADGVVVDDDFEIIA